MAAVDGSNEVRLTFDELRDQSPTWSPDGRVILFETAVDPDHRFVGRWALRAYSLADAELTTVVSDGNINIVGRWHPTTGGVFFQRFEFGAGGHRLAYVDADGTGLTMLTPPGEYDDVHIDPIVGPNRLP